MEILGKIWFRCVGELRRVGSVRHAYDFPEQQGGWNKYGPPVLGDKTTGSLFDPFVRRYHNKFVMYVSHRNSGSIVRAESADGIVWSDMTPVLSGIAESGWEQVVNRAAVVKREKRWLMWYTGQANHSSAIGAAESLDGIHFNRCLKNPVLFPEYAYEKKSVMNPCVIWDEEEHVFKMWYAAGETYEPDVICYAASEDGLVWHKSDLNPVFSAGYDEYDKAKVGGCDVIKLNSGKYLMFYIGYQNIDNARICAAQSDHGVIGWKRSLSNPILSPGKGGWDAHAVYKPTVCMDEKRQNLLLWYNGRNRCEEYIGFAQKEIEEED